MPKIKPPEPPPEPQNPKELLELWRKRCQKIHRRCASFSGKCDEGSPTETLQIHALAYSTAELCEMLIEMLELVERMQDEFGPEPEPEPPQVGAGG